MFQVFQRLSEKKGATAANQQFTASQEGDRSRHRYVLRAPGFENVSAIILALIVTLLSMILGKVQILQCIAVLKVTMEGRKGGREGGRGGSGTMYTHLGVRLLMADMKHDKMSQIMCVT